MRAKAASILPDVGKGLVEGCFGNPRHTRQTGRRLACIGHATERLLIGLGARQKRWISKTRLPLCWLYQDV
jgi:hypothetical protein